MKFNLSQYMEIEINDEIFKIDVSDKAIEGLAGIDKEIGDKLEIIKKSNKSLKGLELTKAHLAELYNRVFTDDPFEKIYAMSGCSVVNCSSLLSDIIKLIESKTTSAKKSEEMVKEQGE